MKAYTRLQFIIGNTFPFVVFSSFGVICSELDETTHTDIRL